MIGLSRERLEGVPQYCLITVPVTLHRCGGRETQTGGAQSVYKSAGHADPVLSYVLFLELYNFVPTFVLLYKVIVTVETNDL